MRAALVASGIAAACSTATPEPGASVRGDSGPVLEERASAAVVPQGPAPDREPVHGEREAVAIDREPVHGEREAVAIDREPAATTQGISAPTRSPEALPSTALDAAAAELRALEPDPAPARTTNDRHYLVSNERRVDLFRPELDDRGGVLLGVGSDQTYVMAAWARSELLVVVDFDQQVVDLHAVHGALLAAAPTMEDFRRLWSEAGADDARAALRSAHPERPALLELYDGAHPLVERRLRRLARRYAELGVRSWLDTPEQYRFVAELHARGRVVAIRGDFTRDGVLRRAAAVLQAHALPVTVLYLSNIEQYFTYRRPYKDNLLALPLPAEALVLRTLPARPAGFHYLLQRGDDLHAWMRAPKVWSVYRMAMPAAAAAARADAPPTGEGDDEPHGLTAGERSWIGAPPPTG